MRHIRRDYIDANMPIRFGFPASPLGIASAGRGRAQTGSMKPSVLAAMLGAAMFACAPVAYADTGANPPGCTTADLEAVRASVQTVTGAYLFTHPDVNEFYNSLEGLSRDQSNQKVQAYMAANPQTQAELAGIRQPLTDIKNRCAAMP